MNKDKLSIIFFLIGVFISSCSQILLKKSANREYKNKIREYINLNVILSYTMFFLATLVNMIAFKNIPLSMGPILESTGYIYVALLSHYILKEKLSIKKLCGICIIIIGIIVFIL